MNTKIEPDFHYVYNEIVAGRILDIEFSLKRLNGSGMEDRTGLNLLFTIYNYSLRLVYSDLDAWRIEQGNIRGLSKRARHIKCWVNYTDKDKSNPDYRILSNQDANKLLAACEDFTGMPISEFTYGLVDYLEEK